MSADISQKKSEVEGQHPSQRRCLTPSETLHVASISFANVHRHPARQFHGFFCWLACTPPACRPSSLDSLGVRVHRKQLWRLLGTLAIGLSTVVSLHARFLCVGAVGFCSAACLFCRFSLFKCSFFFKAAVFHVWCLLSQEFHRCF